MRRLFITLLLAGMTAAEAGAQDAAVTVEPLQAGAANFLTLPTDARSAAMAGAGVALAGHPQAVFHNGAAVFGSPEKAGAAYTYSPWMRDFQSGYQLHTVGGFYRLNDRHAILAGFRHLGYPSLLGGEGQPSVKAKEWAVEAGYAFRLLDGLSVAATARYVYSALGEVNGKNGASTVAFDAGIFYQQALAGEVDNGDWTVGLQAANFGPQMSYLSGKEYLPAVVKAGGAVRLPFSLFHQVTLTTDVACRMQPSDVRSLSVSAGAEYSLLDLLFLRGGYHYGDKEKADCSYGTAGAGLSLYGAQVDFSWLFAGKDCAFRNTWWITVGYRF